MKDQFNTIQWFILWYSIHCNGNSYVESTIEFSEKHSTSEKVYDFLRSAYSRHICVIWLVVASLSLPLTQTKRRGSHDRFAARRKPNRKKQFAERPSAVVCISGSKNYGIPFSVRRSLWRSGRRHSMPYFSHISCSKRCRENVSALCTQL